MAKDARPRAIGRDLRFIMLTMHKGKPGKIQLTGDEEISLQNVDIV
jgi:hypothetical protein